MTERDLAILRFINEFGFCEMTQIQKEFKLSVPRSYQLMKKLTTAGLVKHERFFYGRPGLFRLTTVGAQYTDLPPLDKIPLAHYHHHLLVIDVQHQLKKHYPEATWISERRLIQEKYAEGLGQKGHLADGWLVLPENKQIAIEVELTLKGKIRTERILKSYCAQFSIKEVWYYCHPKTLSTLRLLTEKIPFIKTHNIQEFLNG